jgi:glutaredoxin 3
MQVSRIVFTSPNGARTDLLVSLLQNAVDGNTVVVFSKSWCPYCKRAKALLASGYPEVKPVIIECVPISSFLCGDRLMSLCRLDERDDGGELQSYLQEKTGQRSVPNIFIS